jgi:hypothetical protein
MIKLENETEPISGSAEIRREFLWVPRVLPVYSTCDTYQLIPSPDNTYVRVPSSTHTTYKIAFKWLVWAYVEHRYQEDINTVYWSSKEEYLKHYHIDTNASTKHWDMYQLKYTYKYD